MNSEAQDLQTTFLNRARKDGLRVAIWLVSGKRLVGKIKGYDRFTVLLEGSGGEQLIFKHAVASISPARESHDRGERPRPPRD